MEPDGPDVMLTEAFVEDHEDLFRVRDGTQWDDRMQARRTASFGVPYNYSGITYPEVPLTRDLERLCDGIEQIIRYRPNNCLANYYPTGDSSMGFHSDSIKELHPGTGVAIISLGDARVLRFRRLKERCVYFDRLLPSGCLLYMAPEIQLIWQHGVPRSADAGARISVTIRRLRDMLDDRAGAPDDL